MFIKLTNRIINSFHIIEIIKKHTKINAKNVNYYEIYVTNSIKNSTYVNASIVSAHSTIVTEKDPIHISELNNEIDYKIVDNFFNNID